MSILYQQFKDLRAQGVNPYACSKQLGFSDSSAYKMEKKRKLELGLIYKSTREPKFVQNEAVPIDLDFGFERGHLAETLVSYHLRRRGFEVFVPTCPISGTDLLISKNQKFFRVEIKGTYTDNRTASVKRTLGRKSIGDTSKAFYKEGSVHFFILVDLIYENIFVVPATEIIKPTDCCLSPDSKWWSFKDRYDLIT